ncbi:MAG: hypothetical protein JW937_09615 [Candidatus Omnitrophica bacterium]|nr:hypothetical protein [Candidatus Omnitrophota bacterium]
MTQATVIHSGEPARTELVIGGRKLRILLMYISVSSGHQCAARAMEYGLRRFDPTLDILNLNAFHYVNPILERMVNGTYMQVIKTRPEVWDYMYDNPWIIRNTKLLRSWVHKWNSKRLIRLIRDFEPDVMACTQAFPCGMVADIKTQLKLNTPLVGVLTDLMPHNYWPHPQVNAYVVGCERSRQRLLQLQVPDEKIHVSGIPIDPKFGELHDKETIARRLGLDPARPVVLIMGGGGGYGPIQELLDGIRNSRLPIQPVVLAGTNAKLYDALVQNQGNPDDPARILHYSHDVDLFMNIASLIVTKPGGLTTSEALAKALPMVILKPIPGQENNNTRVLLDAGVAVKADDHVQALRAIEELFGDHERMKRMRDAAFKLGKPNAAVDSASLLLRLSNGAGVPLRSTA